MTENFPKLVLDIKPQIQEAHITPGRINVKKLHLGISYSNYRKAKTKRKLTKKLKNKNTCSGTKI